MEWNEVRRAINDDVALVFFIEKVEDKISSRDMHVLSGSTGAAGAGGASSAAGNEGGDELHDD